jgi:hypothetical protein
MGKAQTLRKREKKKRKKKWSSALNLSSFQCTRHQVIEEMPRRIRHCPITLFFAIVIIVIKPGPGIDPVKGPGPGFYGSTRVNPDQPGKIKKYIY